MHNTPQNFTAGKTRFHYDAWAKLTSDPYILSWTSGVKIDFELDCDFFQGSFSSPPPLQFSPVDFRAMSAEIVKMAAKGIIESAEPSQDQFVSNIFCRHKKDGSCRIILNLKRLNDYVEYHKFKMDTLKTAISLMRQDCYMASVDLKDAYYSIPVHENDRKFLRFYWLGQLWQFTCLPNGLSEAPRKFTKLLKVPFSHLRKEGHVNSAYLDDSFLMAEEEQDCQDNVITTVDLLDSLGFTVHPDKSILVPTQILIFLGFVLNSILMCVSLTSEKADKIIDLCRCRLQHRSCTIRQFSELIGTLVASEPGVEYAPLYFRALEREKSEALKKSYGNFDEKMFISDEACADIQWFIDNVATAQKQIIHPEPTVIIQSDSSDLAWGGVYMDKSTGGPWSAEERDMHINEKELMAVFLTLQCFCRDMTDCHIRLQIDNTTAVAYINNQGGKKKHLHNTAKLIWTWARDRNIWLSAAHLPGAMNTLADFESRRVYGSESEWMLLPWLFQDVMSKYDQCEIDLFASRLNKQLDSYVSWHPDPGALAIDAFTLTWTNKLLYAFPPFSLISRVLAKVAAEGAEMVLIAPLWPTQAWFGSLLRMTVRNPLLLPRNSLTLPTDPEKTHTLERSLKLTAFRISGVAWKARDFRQKLPTSSCHHGESQQRNNMGLMSTDGCSFVVNKKLIHCIHLHRYTSTF